MAVEYLETINWFQNLVNLSNVFILIANSTFKSSFKTLVKVSLLLQNAFLRNYVEFISNLCFCLINIHIYIHSSLSKMNLKWVHFLTNLFNHMSASVAEFLAFVTFLSISSFTMSCSVMNFPGSDCNLTVNFYKNRGQRPSKAIFLVTLVKTKCFLNYSNATFLRSISQLTIIKNANFVRNIKEK